MKNEMEDALNDPDVQQAMKSVKEVKNKLPPDKQKMFVMAIAYFGMASVIQDKDDKQTLRAVGPVLNLIMHHMNGPIGNQARMLFSKPSSVNH